MGRNKKSVTSEDFQSEGVGIMLAWYEDLVMARTGGLEGGRRGDVFGVFRIHANPKAQTTRCVAPDPKPFIQPQPLSQTLKPLTSSSKFGTLSLKPQNRPKSQTPKP